MRSNSSVKSLPKGMPENEKNTMAKTVNKPPLGVLRELRREIGIGGALMIGIGSIIGSGVFVSIAIAAEIAGADVIVAIALAALVAICNGFSSAQLAANFPVSGGTYEYGYRLLTDRAGFLAGWTFMIAKSASAATAALGVSGYLIAYFGGADAAGSYCASVSLALGILVALTILALLGIQRTNAANTVIVSVTIFALMCFVVAGTPVAAARLHENLSATFSLQNFLWDGQRWSNLLKATALMFVAYTGYGRIATLGEEVKSPRRTIPIAVVATLLVSMVLYLAVAVVSIGVMGGDQFARSAEGQCAPLKIVADGFSVRWVAGIISVGAVTALLSVLLNLLLGLSRVLLAMARRRDMPPRWKRVSSIRGVPVHATIVVAVSVGLLILIGDLRLTWSLSAFAVLIYYSITNLCALRLTVQQRVFPIWTAWVGLFACVMLAFWVDRYVWGVGIAVISLGLLWRQVALRMFQPGDFQSGH